MTDRLDPALSAEEWREFQRDLQHGLEIGLLPDGVGYEVAHCAYYIAVNNAALPDTDPRKITREWVTFLREQAVGAFSSDYRGADAAEFTAMADALESYLPPE